MATVRPSETARERIAELVDIGIACFRVNFARRASDRNLSLLAALGDLREAGVTTVFADLAGHKDRLDPIPERLQLPLGTKAELTIRRSDAVGTTGLSIPPPSSFDTPEPGDRLHIGDATIELTDVHPLRLTGIVVTSGDVYTGCAVIVPCRYTPYASLSLRDRKIVDEVAALADHVCVSFADSATVLDEARAAIERRAQEVVLVAKVESPVAVHAIGEICDSADAVLAGRGDLSGFYDMSDVNEVACRILREARWRGLETIAATDYFRSMVVDESRGVPDEVEVAVLAEVVAESPDYVLLNETSISPNWRRIASSAVRLIQTS